MASVFFWFSGLVIAPLMLGIINRTKAFFAGRKGAPLLQPYSNLRKYLYKGAVYSSTTTFLFRLGPIAGLAAIIIAGLMIPLGSVSAPVSFSGDLILFAYLFGLARFFTVVAALDTGSSFEGMGGSREVWISCLAEPVLFLVFGTLVCYTGEWSLSDIMASLSIAALPNVFSISILLGISLLMVVLAENSRIPVDDPNTHLELTMIHEVMVLDHCGVDLGFIMYGSALKLWITGSIFVNVVFPVRFGNIWLDGITGIFALLFLSVLIGIIESSMARLRFNSIPQFLIGAFSLAAIALIAVLRGI